jgi:gamma-glutamyltranspeptidase / glutathione hydrolase
MHKTCRVLLVLFFVLISPFTFGNEPPATAAIASAHPLATQAGFEILNQGGNAFDAAVAVSAALAVVEPSGSGLGGGGFWLLHRAEDGFQTMVDGREKAPAAAHRDMYLDENGEFDKNLSLNGPLAAGIPGVPAALDHLSKRYGRLPLNITLAPAIRYAKQGFKVTNRYQQLIGFRINTLKLFPEANAIFLVNENVPQLDHLIIQPNLANTLEQIVKQGRAGFYQGDVAEKLIAGVQQNGGIWTQQDLLNYQVMERAPIIGHYQGYKITSAAPSSSGGIAIMSMLNQLEHLPFEQASPAQKKHLLAEVMRRTYFDRSRFLGDSDFVDVPTQRLISKTYAQELTTTIDLEYASNSNDIVGVDNKGEDTTHFSIIDSDGNRVSATLSINYPFGAAFMPEGTGVLLNDEMDDFSAQIGAANVYGLVGNEANAIAANKRPLSSMSPTFIENDDNIMVIGTPGGSRIITMVLLGILDFIDGKKAPEIVQLPRFHHQYVPDVIQVENRGFTDTELDKLKQRGHQIKQLSRRYGNMQIVIQDKKNKTLSAASDPRGEGSAKVVEISIQH